MATLARTPPLRTHTGLGEPAFDSEGRTIVTQYPGFRLYNLYVPNGQHDHGRVPFKLDFYKRLLEQCDELHARGENIILCGDFNTAHREIDLRNPKQNENSTGFLPEERACDRSLPGARVRGYLPLAVPGARPIYLVDIPDERPHPQYRLAAGLFPDLPGLVDRVEDAVIHDEVLGADHCPVSLVIISGYNG